MERVGPPFDSDVFTIPHRPTKTAHDEWQVTDDTGEPVTDDEGEPVLAGGGVTIDGFTTFHITTPEYDPDAVDSVVMNADEWGSYAMSKWEEYNYQLFDTEHHCPFEVRVLPDRVAVDVKASTTSDCVQQFVEALIARVGADVDWTIERLSERLAA